MNHISTTLHKAGLSKISRHNSTLAPERTSRDGGLSSRGQALNGTQNGRISGNGEPFDSRSFYLSVPHTESDIRAVANLANDKNFLYATFNDALRDKVPPYTAAAALIVGTSTKTDFSMVVRLTDTNEFAGCIKLKKDQRGEFEIGYFFVPQHQKRRLGTQSVLRAVHWLTQEQEGFDWFKSHKLPPLRKLTATFDPDNRASFKILHKLGLYVVKGGYTPESPYSGQSGESRPRMIMEARIPTDTTPALEAALQRGDFSLNTKVYTTLQF